MPGPGIATVNNGQPTFPVGSVVNNGSGPVVTGAGGTGTNGQGQSVAQANDPNKTYPTAEPTAAQVYNTGNPDLDAALKAQADSAKAAAGRPDPSDPAVQAQIRAQTLAQFQAEIDSTNSIYASKLAAAKVQGQGRLGSATATEARGGLLGSDFGAAQDATVAAGNDSIYSGIQSEQQAAIAAIMDKSNSAATSAIKDQTAARQAGLDNYVKYLQDASTRKTTNATSAAKAILAAGIDPSKLTQDQINTYTANYGISIDDLTKAYAAEKPDYDAAKAKAAKDAQTTVPQGSTIIGADGKPVYTNPKNAAKPTSVQEYEYAQGGGYKGSYTQFLKETANLKNPPVGTGTKPTTADIQSMKGQLDAVKGTDGYISPTDYATGKQAWVGAGFPSSSFDSTYSAYKNPADKYN